MNGSRHESHPSVSMLKKTVAVSVATIWTKPESPRELDQIILIELPEIGKWAKEMSAEERLDLCTANRTQTQVLFGQELWVVREIDGWSEVRIPDQPTSKNSLGYPGWVPTSQLSEWIPVNVDRIVQVTARKTLLTRDKAETDSPLELSYMTLLPYVREVGEDIIVETPHGDGALPSRDVMIAQTSQMSVPVGGQEKGERIKQEALKFVQLPYLWGGLSAYGYDCSGFAYSMHASQGIRIPRDASDQAKAGINITRENLRSGDLLFFAYEEGKGRVHHVGIYIGEDRMIHSPDSNSCIEIVELSSYKLQKEHSVSKRFT
ncbi:C40 family peptidase [Paenibacillus sp. Marseille-Q4541]|uniref:C40 family peptidase n=1 Tax=Paenibacillus sp. Marseille-Q4541 TaxID=2831522 RepID=UPI0020185E45|nr:C40 family peptidase [Paenibacillus sp. Marseille-Q4541]